MGTAHPSQRDQIGKCRFGDSPIRLEGELLFVGHSSKTSFSDAQDYAPVVAHRHLCCTDEVDAPDKAQGL